MEQDNSPASVEARVPDWIEALESGRYEQTTHAMYDGRGYCCFGIVDEVIFGERFIFHQGSWADSRCQIEMLPPERLLALGLDEEATDAEIEDFHELASKHHPELDATKITQSLCTDAEGYTVRPARYNVLAALNDARIPFSQIARYIRASGWFAHLSSHQSTTGG